MDHTIPEPSAKPTAREREEGIVRVGARTLLRYARREDGPAFIELLSRSREHLLPWMPRTARGGEPSFGRRFARMLRPECESSGRLRLLVCDRVDGRIIGVCSLSGIAGWPSLACHAGYWLGTGETGRGFMRDALATMLDHAFDTMGLHRVAANILPANRRSISLVRALGFEREGLARGLVEIDGAWRDHEVWAMLASGWRGGSLDRSRESRPTRRTADARERRVVRK